MKRIELNIPPQYLYFILISIFVATFFGIILYVSSGEESSAQNLPSPSTVNFADVLSASAAQNPQTKKPYSGIGPNPNEKSFPTPTPSPSQTPTPSPSPSPSPTPTPTPTSTPNNPTPTPTSTPTPTPTSTPAESTLSSSLN